MRANFSLNVHLQAKLHETPLCYSSITHDTPAIQRLIKVKILTTIYGIPNCDSVRKARQWLEAHQIDYRFHDFRVDGLDSDMLIKWLATLPMTALLNKRSTSWKQLNDNEKEILQHADIDDNASTAQQAAVALLTANPTLIKRPVLDTGQQLMVGFSDNTYNGAFGQ